MPNPFLWCVKTLKNPYFTIFYGSGIASRGPFFRLATPVYRRPNNYTASFYSVGKRFFLQRLKTLNALLAGLVVVYKYKPFSCSPDRFSSFADHHLSGIVSYEASFQQDQYYCFYPCSTVVLISSHFFQFFTGDIDKKYPGYLPLTYD